MRVAVKHKGSFKNLDKFLKHYNREKLILILNQLGQEGVLALASATPVDSGITSESWGYNVKVTDTSLGLEWFNDHVEDGLPIVILLQYGHATRNGGWVQGKDFINPAIQPIFDKIANALWWEVTNL